MQHYARNIATPRIHGHRMDQRPKMGSLNRRSNIHAILCMHHYACNIFMQHYACNSYYACSIMHAIYVTKSVLKTQSCWIMMRSRQSCVRRCTPKTRATCMHRPTAKQLMRGATHTHKEMHTCITHVCMNHHQPITS